MRPLIGTMALDELDARDIRKALDGLAVGGISYHAAPRLSLALGGSQRCNEGALDRPESVQRSRRTRATRTTRNGKRQGGGAVGAAAKIKERRNPTLGKRAPTQPREERAPPGWQRARLRSLAACTRTWPTTSLSPQSSGPDRGAPRRRWRPGSRSAITRRGTSTLGADSTALSAAISRHLASGGKYLELWFRDVRGVQVVAAPPGSLLGEVAKVAAELSDRFRWNRWDATRWVVCGGDPPLPWVFRWKPELRGLHRGEVTDTATRLTIEVDPSAARPKSRPRMAGPGRRFSVAPGSARLRRRRRRSCGSCSPSPRTSRMLPWDELLRRWNAGPGRKHGKYDREDWHRWNFRRELRAAWDRLVRVGWTVPRGSG